MGEHSTGTASMRAANPTSARVMPPAAWVVRETVTSLKLLRARSGWWPAALATGASALKNARAASKLRATRKRVRDLPSGETVQAGRAGRWAARAAGERSGVSLGERGREGR